jgi:hypothetical protein
LGLERGGGIGYGHAELAAVDETKGLGRIGSQWVDYNCNDLVDLTVPHHAQET